jgi:hypothetical protein
MLVAGCLKTTEIFRIRNDFAFYPQACTRALHRTLKDIYMYVFIRKDVLHFIRVYLPFILQLFS